MKILSLILGLLILSTPAFAAQVGRGANNIPLNKFLGSLAFRNDVSTVGSRYTSDNGAQAISTSLATVVYEDTAFERGVTCVSGVCTVQAAGIYQINACLRTAAVNLSTSQSVAISIKIGTGPTTITLSETSGTGISKVHYACTSPVVYSLTAGETIEVQASSSVATTWIASGTYNMFNIVRLGQ